MDKAREQHNVLMDKGREQLTAFGVSCYSNVNESTIVENIKNQEENDKLEDGGK